MTKAISLTESDAIARSRVGIAVLKTCRFQTLMRVNGGIAIADSSFLATG